MGKGKGQEDCCFQETQGRGEEEANWWLPPQKPKQDNALKLALSSKLTTALVTQHYMSQINSEAVFNSVYNEAIAEGQQEN